jgi:hypothetical protein
VRAPAQQLGWTTTVQANASIFFGATSQQLVAAAGNVARADSSVEADLGLQFRYGQSRGEDGDRTVQARAWLASLSFDAKPFATVSPFVFGTAEHALEKRIASRVSGGAGAKWTVARTPTGEASLSAALLGERTRAMGDGTPGAESLLRWSFRLKTSHRVRDRLQLSHASFYQPVVNDTDRFLVLSTSVAALGVSERISFTLSLVHNYDSEARARGARANSDGQLLAGIQAAF